MIVPVVESCDPVEVLELLREIRSAAQAALEQLRVEGFPVRAEDVVRLSPLIHDHINLLGRYAFSLPEAVQRGELRPLRNPADSIEEVA